MHHRITLFVAASLLAGASLPARALTTPEVICSFAPSQSTLVADLVQRAGGGGTVMSTLLTATGLKAVPYASGAQVLTGASGYVANALGSAVVGSTILTVGATVLGAAATIELLCAPVNRLEQVEQVKAAAIEFGNRFSARTGQSLELDEVQTNEDGPLQSAANRLNRWYWGAAAGVMRTTVAVKRVTGSVIDYAYRQPEPAPAHDDDEATSMQHVPDR